MDEGMSMACNSGNVCYNDDQSEMFGKFSIKVGNEQLDRLECEKQRIRELPQLCLTEGDFKVPVEGDTGERSQDFPEDSGPARWIPLMPDLKRRNRRYLFSRCPRG